MQFLHQRKMGAIQIKSIECPIDSPRNNVGFGRQVVTKLLKVLLIEWQLTAFEDLPLKN